MLHIIHIPLVKRQKGLNINHFHTELDPFVFELTISLLLIKLLLQNKEVSM